MICPSCGKQIPDDSAYCLCCGVRVDAPEQSTRRYWEYKTFIWHFPPSINITLDTRHRRFQQYSARDYVDAREILWTMYSNRILEQLQEWLDQGWSTNC